MSGCSPSSACWLLVGTGGCPSCFGHQPHISCSYSSAHCLVALAQPAYPGCMLPPLLPCSWGGGGVPGVQGCRAALLLGTGMSLPAVGMHCRSLIAALCAQMARQACAHPIVLLNHKHSWATCTASAVSPGICCMGHVWLATTRGCSHMRPPLRKGITSCQEAGQGCGPAFNKCLALCLHGEGISVLQVR